MKSAANWFSPTVMVFAIAMAFALCAAPSQERAIAQGPSDKNPQALIVSWTDATIAPDAAKYYSSAAKFYAETHRALEKYEAAVNAKSTSRLNLLAVGQTYSATLQLKRLATRLSGWGEPAGHDLLQRVAYLEQRLEKVRSAMRDALVDKIKAALPAFAARAEKQKNLREQVAKMVNDGKLAAAEKKYLVPYLELAAMASWYEYQQRLGTIHPFDVVEEKLANAIIVENLAIAARTIDALREQTRPDLKKLPAALENAANQLAARPDAEFEGKSLPGPKLFLAAIKQWQIAHRAALRTVALQWARSSQPGGAAQSDEIAGAYPEFQKRTIAGLVKLIDAEATRASEADAPALHAAYLDLAAKLGSVSRDDAMMKDFSVALDKLAAKSPALAADVAAYHGATDDLLRWRNRASEAMAKARRPKVNVMPLKAADSSVAPIELPVYVEQLKDEILEKDFAVVGHFLGNSGEGPAMSGFLKNMIVRVQPPAFDATAELETDLLVSAQKPPLTLAAARALAAAKRGDFIEAGGVGAGVEILGMVPFFALDTPQRRNVIPLGDFGSLAEGGLSEPQKHVLISAELNPTWIRGDGFFVEFK